jgi:hypothetical protein
MPVEYAQFARIAIVVYATVACHFTNVSMGYCGNAERVSTCLGLHIVQLIPVHASIHLLVIMLNWQSGN